MMRALLLAALCATSICATAADAARARYLIELTRAPVLSFGGDTVLKATRPEPGARFDADSASAQLYLGVLTHAQDDWLSAASSVLGRQLIAVQRYRYTYNGLALDLNSTEAACLAQLVGVRAIEPDAVAWLATDAGPAWIGAASVWTGVPGANATRG